jgi:protein-arginine deiminase
VGVPEAEKDGVKWNGFVDLTYTVAVNGKPVSTSTSPDGTDRARMRVAPWMMNGNTTPYTDTLMAINYGQPLLPAMQAAVDAHNAANPNTPVNFLRIKDYNDQWVEDWIQTGTASIPWADGAVTGMRLAMPRPFSNGGGTLPVSWLRKSHTYADTGHFVVYKKAPSGSSFDSHGNHDLVPAYSHNGQSFPFGRIIHGSSILSETHEFYNAQQAQGPALVVKTSWLLVGHVDEVFSYVPAATPRGWKLLVASAKLARTQLQDWQKAGQGSATMFYGKKWGANKGGANAEVSIDAVLGDTALMAESQKAQTEIDGMVATMKSEVGLTDDEIVELPTLFEADGGMIAFQPGVVNSRVFNGYIVVPEPFGPKVVNGQDGIREFIKEQLATEKNKLGADGKGLKVFFADDWDLYHRLDGEVHCGSNTSAPPQKEWKWWEKVQ